MRERIVVLPSSTFADLLPGGLHVVLLVLLHDAGAEARGDPVAGIEVELLDPLLVVGHRVGAAARAANLGVPAPVERRHDQRVLVGLAQPRREISARRPPRPGVRRLGRVSGFQW